MSERVELLREELLGIFGPVFGHVVEAPGSLTEDVGAYLEGRRPGGVKGAPPSSRGKVRGKGFDRPAGKMAKKSKGKKKSMAAASPEDIERIAQRTGKKKQAAAKEKKAEVRGKRARAAFKGNVAKRAQEIERQKPDWITKKAKETGEKPEAKKTSKEAEARGRRAIAAFRGNVSKKEKEHKAKEAEKAKRAAAEKAKARKAAERKFSGKPSGGGSGVSAKEKTAAGKARGGPDSHFPFKRSPNLGPGPMDRHHDETKCWNCTCPHGSYAGCNCTSTGRGENCPPKGTEKTVRISKPYKKKYNEIYRNWRKSKGGEVTARLGKTRSSL